MYVRKTDLTFTINDNAQYTSTDGTKYPRNYPKDEIDELAKVTETEKPIADVITGFHVDNTYTQVWETRGFTTEELTAKKQALLDSIEPLQQRVFSNNSDVWAIKFQDSEYDNDLTSQQKQYNKTFNKKVITWRKTVRLQNNNITIDNTLEEIQARIDRINELDEIFPEV